MTADILNSVFDNSGIDVFTADAMIEITKSSIIAVFLINPSFSFVIKQRMRLKDDAIKVNTQA